MQTDITLTEESQLGFPVEASENPALVYLSALPSKKSQRTMRVSLKSLITMIRGEPAEDADVYLFPWWNLGYQHTQALRASLMKSEYTPATINRMLSALRGVLQECWRLKLMEVEEYKSAADLANVKDTKLPSGRYVPVQDVQKMLADCYRDTNRILGTRDVALIALLYLLGPRREEISVLTLADFDPNDGGLRIQGKGRKERKVYIVGECLEKLQAWLDIRGLEPGRLFYHIERNGTAQDAGISGNAIYEVIHQRSEAAGIEKTTPHDFRRSAISNLLYAGVDPITVAAITGHASVEMVKRYDRRNEQPKIDALRLLTLK